MVEKAHLYYAKKMMASASVHCRKSGIAVGDSVVICSDFNSHQKTRKKKMTLFNEKDGKVFQICENGYYLIDIDNEQNYFRANQLKRI